MSTRASGKQGFTERYGQYALVVGAAEGLGAAFSQALAARGMHLVMADHQAEKLSLLSVSLEREYGISTLCIHLDLEREQAAEMMIRAIAGLDCRLMVYVAAYSHVQPFLQYDAAGLNRFIEVNIRSQVRLVHGFAQRLTDGRGGGIILLSSLAGLIGTNLVAPYAATKAFAWNLAESLSHELKPYGIDVMACISGAARTPAFLGSSPNLKNKSLKVAEPSVIAESSLRALGKKTLFIPLRSARFQYFILTRLMPRKMASRLVNRVMRRLYPRFGA